MNKNPYEILGVSKNASDAEIKSAYRKLVIKHHPDKNPGDKAAEEKFKDVNNAYDVLKDPQKRAAYDQFGPSAFAGGNGASAGGGPGGNPFGNMGGGAFHFDMGGDINDFIKQAMRNMGFDSGDSGVAAARGRDLLHDIEITLKEAYSGKTETIRFTSNAACDKCKGNGTADGKPAPICKTCGGTGAVRRRSGLFAMESVCPDCGGLGRKISKKCAACDGLGVHQKRREIKIDIPAGVMDGARLRFAGLGDAGMLGAAAGDFFVDVHVRPDSRFVRHGDDLFMRASVPFATLALGGETEIETIDDKKLNVKIPAGTQVGDRMRIRGRGMPGGNLFVEIAVEIPTKLTDKQKKALEEFAGLSGKKRRGIF
jgi:molecular chaperone DnaJ